MVGTNLPNPEMDTVSLLVTACGKRVGDQKPPIYVAHSLHSDLTSTIVSNTVSMIRRLSDIFSPYSLQRMSARASRPILASDDALKDRAGGDATSGGTARAVAGRAPCSAAAVRGRRRRERTEASIVGRAGGFYLCKLQIAKRKRCTRARQKNRGKLEGRRERRTQMRSCIHFHCELHINAMKRLLSTQLRPLAAALFLLATAALSSTAAASSTSAATASSPFQYDPTSQYPTPSLLRDGLGPFLSTRWAHAQSIALLEQAVEDHNAEHVATSSNTIDAISYRRCIVLPLDERFDPPVGVFSHGHVDTGDKMSLPRNFWDAIAQSKAEVPWLFEVARVDGVTSPRVPLPADEHHHPSAAKLGKAVGGALDFRCPANYAFLPRWMFAALGLRPRDVVDVRLVTNTPPGSAVRLRPHTTAFVNIGNHQAVLETELKHYSALTLGSTIPFDYRGERYYFDVVDLRSAPRGERAATAKVQDCDIAAEFVRARDQLKPKKKRKRTEEED
ncbi:hypothetical protein ACHAXT_013281 [Thalassiosira profunda]